LRPELAAYKAALPFMRPKPDANFAGDLFNASGLAYAMQYHDAQVHLLAVFEALGIPHLLWRLPWRLLSLWAVTCALIGWLFCFLLQSVRCFRHSISIVTR
jgi:hypothetical protein